MECNKKIVIDFGHFGVFCKVFQGFFGIENQKCLKMYKSKVFENIAKKHRNDRSVIRHDKSV